MRDSERVGGWQSEAPRAASTFAVDLVTDAPPVFHGSCSSIWPFVAANLPCAQRSSLHVSALLLDNFDIKVPVMGESVSEGTVATIMKKPGEGPPCC